MELGQQLKAHRKELGISQDELAEKIFVSRQSISNWENNKSNPDIHTLLLLAETFGVSLDELIKGDVEEMIEDIIAQERAGFNRDTVCFAIFGIVTVLSIAPLYAFLDYIGCLIWALIVGVAGYFCGRVELYKTMFDIQPYKEILAFQQGADLSTLSAVRAERNVVKHRASKAVKAIASALIGGASGFGGAMIAERTGAATLLEGNGEARTVSVKNVNTGEKMTAAQVSALKIT